MTVSVSLSEVAEVNPSTATGGLSAVDPVDFFPMAAVDADMTVARASERRAFELVSKGYTSFCDGDVLLAKITPCFENGKIAQAAVTTGVAFGSTEFHVLRCGAELDGRYLVHFLRRQQVRTDGQRKMTGSGGQRRVPRHYLESLEIPLPPLPEQRRIAAILDKADALRTQRREALAQLDRLAQAIFVEMFGDPVSNPKEWDTVAFDDFYSDETSGCAKLQTSDYQQDGGFPVIDQGQRPIAGYCDDESMLAQVLLPITLFGDHTRAVKHIDFPFIVGADGAKVLKPLEKINSRFASFLLGVLPIPNLGYSRHMKEVKRLTFIIPPRYQQDNFEARLRNIDGVKKRHCDAQQAGEDLLASLQHRAFRGEL